MTYTHCPSSLLPLDNEASVSRVDFCEVRGTEGGRQGMGWDGMKASLRSHLSAHLPIIHLEVKWMQAGVLCL